MSSDLFWRMEPCRRRHRPSLTQINFESAADAWKIDCRRALMLRRSVEREEVTGRLAAAALALADRLDPQIPSSPAPTMASARSMRTWRDRAPGHLWAVLDQVPGPRRFFTLIPRYGDVPAHRLARFRPAGILGRLRAALNDRGATGAEGLLWCVLEASYEIRLNLFRFHVHGVATGALVKVIDRLRKTRALKGGRRRGESLIVRVHCRTKLSRRELFNQPYPLTYTMKSFWSAHWVSDAGKRSRRQGIRGRAAVQALVWQDRWGPGDLVLMRGMRAHRRGFSLISTRASRAK